MSEKDELQPRLFENLPGIKKCKQCRLELDIDQFPGYNKARPYYNNTTCKSCLNERSKAWGMAARRRRGARPKPGRVFRYPPGKYIYLMRLLETNRYKIGFSTRPEVRRDAIRQARPWENIQLLCAIPTDGDKSLEKTLLDMYQPFGCGGEWFEFDDQEQILTAFLNKWPYELCEDFSSRKRQNTTRSDIPDSFSYREGYSQFKMLVSCRRSPFPIN